MGDGRGDQPAEARKKTRATRDGSHAGKHTAMAAMGPMTQPNRMPIVGLKPKDLVGIPWRVAFALQAAGWWLRADCIWSKPNPMPESTKDRPTRSHEYVFLLSKSQHYRYDYEAVKEPAVCKRLRKFTDGGIDKQRGHSRKHEGFNGRYAEKLAKDGIPTKRNLRSVWSIAPQPFHEAHFAVFPEKLAERCILAGAPVGGVVLDPFMGAGTVALVSMKHGRRFVGVELNPEYAEIARKRIAPFAQGVLPVAAVAPH
jgi:DNA modification methylase